MIKTEELNVTSNAEMTDDERFSVIIRNMFEKNFLVRGDSIEIDGWKFDFIALSKKDKEAHIVYHRIVDNLCDEAGIPRIIADKAISKMASVLGKFAGDFEICFAEVQCMFIDDKDGKRRAIVKVCKYAPIVKEDVGRFNAVNVKMDDDDYPVEQKDENKLEPYKARMVEEFNELADRTIKLCTALIMTDKQRGYKFKCPKELLNEQLNCMKEYLAILFIRGNVENVPLDEDKMRQIITMVEAKEMIDEVESDGKSSDGNDEKDAEQ